MHTCTYTRAHTHIRAHACVPVHTHACMHTQMYTHQRERMYAWTHIRVHPCTLTHTHAHVTNPLSHTITPCFDGVQITENMSHTHLGQWKYIFWSHFVCVCKGRYEITPLDNATPVRVSRVQGFFRGHSCDMFEPRVRTTWLLRISTLVLLRVYASTQAVAGTCTHLAATALQFCSVRNLRNFWTVRELGALSHWQLACTCVSKDASNSSPPS